jgi:hypothetical protein
MLVFALSFRMSTAACRGLCREYAMTDILYFSILIAFYVLISLLAVGCARLQKRKAGLRQRNAASASTPSPSLT